jgi:hypothetical protein
MERGKGHICNTTPKFYQIARPTTGRMRAPHRTASASRTEYSYANPPLLYRVTVDMRQHCTDGSFRFCRWRAHTEAFSEDSGPEALSTHGQYFALQVFCEILKHIAGKLSANCCRTITMTRYMLGDFPYE